MSYLRPFEPKDLGLFMALSHEFLAESPVFSSVPDFSVDRLMEFWERMLWDETVFQKIGYVNDQPAGMVVGRREKFIFSHATFACDVMFYVKPEFRNGFLLKRFLKAFEDWAFSDPSTVWMQLNALANENNERVAQLTESLGYPRVGVIHCKRKS